MVDVDKLQGVIVVLANDALEASERRAGHAALLLVDAAVSLLVSRLQGAAAREIADMLCQYIDEQVCAVEAARGGAHG